MRTLEGTKLRISEMTRLEHTRTNVVASPMPMPFCTEVVTASVGHMPSTRRKVGFSVIRPFRNIFLYSCFAIAVHLPYSRSCAAASTSLTAPVTALEVMVAAVMALIS